MGRRRLLLVLAAAVAPASALVAPQIATRKISDRRSLLSDVLASTAALTVTACTCTSTQPALAVAPFAPIDALLPAARVKLTLDQAVAIASKIDAEDAKAKNQRLGELEGLLLAPQNYTRGTTQMEVPQRPAQSYLDAYADYRNKVSLLEKPGAMLVQNGEIDAWKRLKRQERAREETDEIRAALNYYTSNLNFDADKFVLTASKEERSKLIREDRVPDVKSVIASDMGLRYLLRNDLLTAVDDARAELRYQIKQSNEGAGVEGKELLELLVAAEGACDGWFGLIGRRTVRQRWRWCGRRSRWIAKGCERKVRW